MLTVQTGLKIYDGDDVSRDFAYDFRILEADDLFVWVHDGTAWNLQVLDTDYTLTGVGDDAGGTVSFITVAPPVTGVANIVFMRQTDFDQLSQLTIGTPFRAETVEQMIDKLTMAVQELKTMFGTPVALGAVRWNGLGEYLEVSGAETGLVDSGSEDVTQDALSVAVLFDPAKTPPDSNYSVWPSANWNTTFSIINKTVSGFTIDFDVAAPAAAKVYWRAYV